MLFALPNSSFRFCSRFQVSFSTVRGKKIVELTARRPRDQDSIYLFFCFGLCPSGFLFAVIYTNFVDGVPRKLHVTVWLLVVPDFEARLNLRS